MHYIIYNAHIYTISEGSRKAVYTLYNVYMHCNVTECANYRTVLSLLLVAGIQTEADYITYTIRKHDFVNTRFQNMMDTTRTHRNLQMQSTVSTEEPSIAKAQ